MLWRRVQVLRPRRSTSGGQGRGFWGGEGEGEVVVVGVEREGEVVDGREDEEEDVDFARARAFQEATDVQDRQLLFCFSPQSAIPPFPFFPNPRSTSRWGLRGFGIEVKGGVGECH